MEKVYLMAGKRFQVGSVETKAVNDALSHYNLVMNVSSGGLWDSTVRRTVDHVGTHRLSLEHSFGDEADFGVHTKGYDFCVGKVIGNTGYGGLPEVIETETSEIEKVLQEVRQDIPDAKVLAFSHWV